MDVNHWMKVLKEAGLISDNRHLTPKPDTILTIHAAGVEVSLKAGSDEVTIDPGEEVMIATNNSTGFVQYIPWDLVTKIEQRRADDHRYRHG